MTMKMRYMRSRTGMSVSIDSITDNRQAIDSGRTAGINSRYIFDWPSREKKTSIDSITDGRQAIDSGRTAGINSRYIFDWPSREKKTSKDSITDNRRL